MMNDDVSRAELIDGLLQVRDFAAAASNLRHLDHLSLDRADAMALNRHLRGRGLAAWEEIPSLRLWLVLTVEEHAQALAEDAANTAALSAELAS